MGKASRAKRRTTAPAVVGDVGPRQPCPCGSGRRYKACHGSGDSSATPFVTRTFAGLPGETDWVALREFVPAASASVAVTGAEHDVVVCSLLPMAAPALVRSDGTIWLGLQVSHDSGDASRDIAHALELAQGAAPGEPVTLGGLPGPGARLQDVVDPGASFDVAVHGGFDFWVSDVEDPTGEVAASLESANAAMTPTRRLASVEAAYWCDVSTKEHLRWVMPYDEEALLDALARLHTADADRLGEDSRLVGSFRAHGLLVPVWDLPVGTGADSLEEPARAFADRLGEALHTDAPLSSEERAARAGLSTRQLTIR